MQEQLDPPPTEPLYLVSILAIHLYLRDLAYLEDLDLSNSMDTQNGVIPILSDVLNPRGGHHTTEIEWKCLDQ